MASESEEALREEIGLIYQGVKDYLNETFTETTVFGLVGEMKTRGGQLIFQIIVPPSQRMAALELLGAVGAVEMHFKKAKWATNGEEGRPASAFGISLGR